MAEEGQKKEISRGCLPGIPSYVDRTSAESIWKDNCNKESAYLKDRIKRPPKCRENFGVLHGFEVIRHPTYTSANRVPSPTASEDSSRAGSVAGSQYAESVRSRSFAAQPPQRRAPTHFAIPNTTLILPKYATFSGDHMRSLEAAGKYGDGTNKSAKALSRALSVPNVTGK